MRVAERHGLEIHLVSHAYMRLPEGLLIGPDAADDWIAERAGKADIVVTADIPLAAHPNHTREASSESSTRCAGACSGSHRFDVAQERICKCG